MLTKKENPKDNRMKFGLGGTRSWLISMSICIEIYCHLSSACMKCFCMFVLIQKYCPNNTITQHKLDYHLISTAPHNALTLKCNMTDRMSDSIRERQSGQYCRKNSQFLIIVTNVHNFQNCHFPQLYHNCHLSKL